MPCAYCKLERGYTEEHLIPMAILDMFPECEFNFTGEKPFKGDRIVINDVCGTCNNGVLSQLDSYGASLVQNHFVREYEKNDNLEFNYQYPLFARWLLKIIYNNARREQLDISWFDTNIDYINGSKIESSLSFSIFGGLAVDMSPMPEFYLNNLKLGVYFNPMLLKESMFLLEGNMVSKRDTLEDLMIENLLMKSLIRFGSGLFLVLLWSPDVTEEYKNAIEKIIDRIYPYSFFDTNKEVVGLERVTHTFNYQQGTFNFIDSIVGMSLVDNTNFFPGIGDPIQKRREDSQKWDTHVSEVRENRVQRRQKERERRKNKKKRNRD